MMMSWFSSHGWKYDVFLSFRGSDTRHSFTGNLYKALCDKGIYTFIDEEELQGGERITPSLVKAIEESRIAIIVFSKNYASSSFCLDELINILACVEEKGSLLLPVFYHVDPSYVRHQRGSYQEALNNHKERFDDQDKVEQWRIALRQAADFSGYHFKHGQENEYDFIEKIVKAVSQKINRTLLHVANYPVGLESRVSQVISLLDGDSSGVHMVGIHGIGGIGKTTIARAVYNLIAEQFEELCFIDNVRENSNKLGLVYLQETLLSKTIGEKGIKLGSVNEGIPIIKQRLYAKKVLLVLDDVDDLHQLQATIGGTEWFGSGSRIIITTRDCHLLTQHGVKSTYKVEGLNKEEALKLLSWCAFKVDKVDPCYQNILNRVVTYASGLPLALEVIGSNLFGQSIEGWESAIDQYERIPNKKIQNILKVSFDSLEEDEQKIFLDIACYFKGCTLAYVKEILSSHHGCCPEYGIKVLIDKSLIKIEGRSVTLHDLIEDMGKEIVRQESPDQPGKRSRLWCPEDIIQVLEENEGTDRIQIIILECQNYVIEWDGMAFKQMSNLKTLIVRDGNFTIGPKHLPNSLRVLEWWEYPSTSLPSDFHPKKLVTLQLPRSCLMSLDLFMYNKKFVNMRVLNFNGCQYIREIPDLHGVPNLQELSLKACMNLMKIDRSVGLLNKLKILDANGCSKLRSFPPIKLTSLQNLHLSYCPNLERFPEILGNMENITHLSFSYTPIKELPFSIQNLIGLQKLEMVGCGSVQLPCSIFKMEKLTSFMFKECDELLLPKVEDEGYVQMNSKVFGNYFNLQLSACNISDEFLQKGLPLFAKLYNLSLSKNDFTILPAYIKECHFLKYIYLEGCERLQEIRGIPPNIVTFSIIECSSLKELDLTLLPTMTKECCFLSELKVHGCKSLQNIKGIPSNLQVLSVKVCASLKDLDLTLPLTCTRECRILSTLTLDNCENLQELKGISSNIRDFSAINCQSLTSESRSMLLNKELHNLQEAGGDKEFIFPGTRIPEWFEHCIEGSSISLWFRNKFSGIALCFLVGPRKHAYMEPIFIINGKKHLFRKWFHLNQVADHLFIFHLNEKPFYDKCEVHFENEWNHVVCTADPPDVFIKQIGIHVFKQGSNMEDIQFTNPMLWKEEHALMSDDSDSVK